MVHQARSANPGTPQIATDTRQTAGLTTAEAEARARRFGPNEIEQARTRGLVAILLGALREPMFGLLIGAAVLYLILGDLGEGLFLTGGAAVAVGLVIFQEARSERALKALRRLAEPYARVIRDGDEQRLPARQLVPGDLILVGEGERLPADAVLVAGDSLGVDESALTGESAAVTKHPDPAAPAMGGEAGGEGGPFLFAGTLIVRGHGSALAARTGANTGLGRIGASLAALGEEATPLQKASGRLVGVLSLVALAFCALVAVAYGLLRHDWIGGILSGITVAISLIPEEFPMVLAVFLALGAWRLARHKVLVRRPAVVEALGGASVLCVDKTGTLTENRMQLARLWREGREEDAAENLSPGGRALVRAAALASAARSIDAMDRAVIEREASLGGSARADRPLATWPLRPERMAIVQLWAEGEGRIAAAKGAPETVFRLCRLDEATAAELTAAVEAMAAEGLRVLAVAAWRGPAPGPQQPEDAVFAFEGLIGFLDPLRPDAAEALRIAHEAGVSVAMITGDYPATARKIAAMAGIDTAGGVLSGPEIAMLDDEQLAARARDVRIFARIQPDQKLRLVQAFRRNGEVVAMTGDGVNDAPALEAADIGIAMGERGTDVAREAADLVLLDDSFASIVGGVRLGRRIFNNLRKALTYVTAIHVPVAGVALAPILMGLPPLLFPMHVVLLELVIDPVCSLVFEAEPSEARVMTRRPRARNEPLFGPRQIIAAISQGLVVFVGVMGLYIAALTVAPEDEARAVAFSALVLANLTLALSDAAAPGVRLFDRHRVAFWSITVVAVLVLAVVLYLPGAETIFHVARPGPGLLAAALAIALASGGWFGLYRRIARRIKG